VHYFFDFFIKNMNNLNKKINFCETCFRLNTNILNNFLSDNKINSLIPYFGFAKYREFNCYHCKKLVSYFTIKDVIYFFEFDN